VNPLKGLGGKGRPGALWEPVWTKVCEWKESRCDLSRMHGVLRVFAEWNGRPVLGKPEDGVALPEGVEGKGEPLP